MSRPRTLTGSAVPLLLLIGLVGFTPAPASAAPADDDQRALAILRRAVDAAASLGYTGTQVASAWPATGASTRLLEIRQWPGGRRLVRVHDPHAGTTSAGDSVSSAALGDLSRRALMALAAAYELRVAGTGQIAGRPATTVVARRGNRDVARLWLDDATGLLLRQDVLDASGRLHRMAAFIDISPFPPSGSPGSAGDGGQPPLANRATRTASLWRVTGPVDGGAAAPTAMSLTQLSGLCRSTTCPRELPGGYQLLDARRGRAGGADVLHLVYGDGLSAISVFLQHGRLDPERLGGLTTTSWAGEGVYVGKGWPVRMTWQGGPQVVTVVSDAAPADLTTAVAVLPHESAESSETGAFATLRRSLQSLLGWLGGD